jgi:hypothetical protein
MWKRRALPIFGLVLVLSLAFAAQALAATIAIDNPDANYLAETTKLDFSAAPNFTAITDITDGSQTLTFDSTLTKRFVGVGGGDLDKPWGLEGEVESTSTAAVYSYSGSVYAQSVTMSLDNPVYEFGFEASPDEFGTFPITATFIVSSGGEVLDTITWTIPNTPSDKQSRLFAIKSTSEFDQVDLVISGTFASIAMAQFRYSETPPTTVRGTVRDATTGVGVPFSHVYVEYGTDWVAEVDADYAGRYEMILPAADYTFYANGPGYPESSEAVTVPEDSPFTQDLELADRYDQPVYRFFNMRGGVHFYTANDAEFINTYANLASVFHYDGFAYMLPWGSREGWTNPNTIPLYRFWNRKTGVHFYTMSEAEKNTVIATRSDDYDFEGVAYNVSDDPTGLPIARFYVPRRDAHFFTADTSEIFGQSKLSSWYHYEGIGFYIADWEPEE